MVPKGYTQHEEEIEVPRGTGVRGFLATIAQVLKLPRVQRVEIDSKGKIIYSFLLRDGEEQRALGMKFDDLMPYAIARNAEVQELPTVDSKAQIALLQMIRVCSIERLYPLAWVTGTGTKLWEWYERTTGLGAELRDELLSFPVFTDKDCPDEALLLFTGSSRHDLLENAQKVYKIVIPQVTP
jgi:HPt (histidine-containing phosphotransfer) domain-containing protein